MSDELIPCNKCTAVCCRQVTVSLDPLETEEDYQEMRWLIVHKNVHICVDEEGDFWVEFYTDCEHLGSHHECKIYENRPQICRDHELDSCEVNGEGEAYPFIFTNEGELNAYITKYYKKEGKKYIKNKN